MLLLIIINDALFAYTGKDYMSMIVGGTIAMYIKMLAGLYAIYIMYEFSMNYNTIELYNSWPTSGYWATRMAAV